MNLLAKSLLKKLEVIYENDNDNKESILDEEDNAAEPELSGVQVTVARISIDLSL
jgi:hypothetical protein